MRLYTKAAPPPSIADSKPPPEFEIENQGEVWILGTKGDAELPAEALVPPHSAGTTAVAPAKAAPPAATTAATAADETPQSSVGTTAGTSSELPAAAPVEPSATTVLPPPLPAVQQATRLHG